MILSDVGGMVENMQRLKQCLKFKAKNPFSDYMKESEQGVK